MSFSSYQEIKFLTRKLKDRGSYKFCGSASASGCIHRPQITAGQSVTSAYTM